MRVMTLLVLLIPLASARAAGIEEIRVADIDEMIVLRANGTADYSYRGRLNWKLNDERVGFFHAKFDPREFHRLEALSGVAAFGEMKDFYLPYSTWIVRTTIVRDGKSKTVERNERGLSSDPETPTDLWGLEMAVRGFGTQLKWDPISSGVRVAIADHEGGVREVMVRELGTDDVVAAVRTSKLEVAIPAPTGNYLIEVSELRDGRFEELWKWSASVPSHKYVAVSAKSPARERNSNTGSLQEFIIQTSNGWWLYCSSDGSGWIGHGPSASDTAAFKPGAIDVAAAMQELKKVTTTEPPLGHRFTVISRRDGEMPSVATTKDSQTVVGLFEQAAQKEFSLDRRPGFDQFWKEHPPALTDR